MCVNACLKVITCNTDAAIHPAPDPRIEPNVSPPRPPRDESYVDPAEEAWASDPEPEPEPPPPPPQESSSSSSSSEESLDGEEAKWCFCW